MNQPDYIASGASLLQTHALLVVGVLLVAIVILVVMFSVCASKAAAKSKAQDAKDKMFSPLGNLSTGNNNPLWQHQMGDAGWGGSMHSTRQPGEQRVWSASADGPHTMGVTNRGLTGSSQTHQDTLLSGCGAVSASAQGEAATLPGAGALDLTGSPPLSLGGGEAVMSDDALVRVMNGGSA